MIFRISIIAAIIYLGCGSQLKKVSETTCYQFFARFPELNEEGRVVSYDSMSMFIYIENDMVVYQLPFIYMKRRTGEKEFTKQRLYHYFVREKNNNWGYNFDEVRIRDNRRMPLDSVLTKAGYLNLKVYDYFKKYKLTLAERTGNPEEGFLEEKYTYQEPSDTTILGTFSFSYTDQLNELNYSLSPELDSINKLKLFKFRVNMNARYIPGYNITIQQSERYNEIKKVPVQNAATFKNYIARYRKEISK